MAFRQKKVECTIVVVVQREGRDSVARRDERTHVAVLAGQRETAAHLKHMINIDN